MAEAKIIITASDQTKDAIESAKKNMQALGASGEMSVKAMSAAMRSLPAQFTDIVTSLQGGQKPLTVLFQQGGQIKDMFGGIGPAAKAMGTYVAGLVNPFTLAAASVGALALAHYQASKEADAYAKALIMTGNAAGLSVGKLQDMAASISAGGGGTKGAASEALVAIASTAGVAASSVEKFANTALQLESKAGIPIKETAKAFAELGESPLQASIKLNESLGYLTASTYNQIKALQEQGKIEAAASLAQNEYSNAMDARSARLAENLGLFERLFKNAGAAAKWAWDRFLDIDRPDSLGEKIAKAADDIQRMQNSRGVVVDPKRLAAAQQELTNLQEQQRLLDHAASTEAARVDSVKARIKFDETGAQFDSNTAKLKKEIAAAENLGLAAGASRAEIEERIGQIRKKYRETGGDFSANFLSQLQGEYSQLNGTISKRAEVTRQLEVNTHKFNAAQKEQALGVADLIDKERRRLAIEAMDKSQVKPFADKARDMQFEVSLIGKTAEETARLRFEYELNNRSKEAGIEIDKLLRKGVIEQSDATRALADIERFAAEARIEYARRAADEHDKQYNALRGLSEGMKDYWQSAERMGENTRNAVQNAFRGMEDAMVNFVKTGKLDFKSLADSVISDLIRIQIQQSITGPLAKGMSSYFLNSGTSSNPSASNYENSLDQGTPWLHANGGVMSGSGPIPLNKYANGGIATSPQLAIFGEGRMNEAYVPLPDGRTIPVTMKGGGNGGINVQIINNNSQAQVSAQPDGQGGLTVLVDMVKNSMADDVFNGVGSMPRAIESRYGLRTAGA